MTAADLLTRCQALDIDLAVGPNGALLWEADADLPSELAEDLAQHKAELLAMLTWNAEAVDREFQQALAVIDAALATSWLTTAQRNVLGIFRLQVEDYHAHHEPLLFGSSFWIEALVARWRQEQQVK